MYSQRLQYKTQVVPVYGKAEDPCRRYAVKPKVEDPRRGYAVKYMPFGVENLNPGLSNYLSVLKNMNL